MSSADDFARMGYVVNNFTDAELLRDKSGNPVRLNQFRDKHGEAAKVIRLYTEIGQNRYFVSNAVVDSSKKQMWVVTAYVQTITDLQALDGRSPHGITSETSVAKSATDIIPAQDADSQRQFSDRDYYAPAMYSKMQREIEGIKQEKIDIYDVVHSVNARVSDPNRQNKGSGQSKETQGWNYPEPFTASTITIRDLLDVVNGTFRSVLSKDVLMFCKQSMDRLFQSTHPVGGGTGAFGLFATIKKFQSTHPVRGGTFIVVMQMISL